MMIHCTGKRNSPRCTGLSKRNGTKFRELSLNFPKMAHSLCIGMPSCQAAQGREFSNRGTFLLHDPVQCSLLNRKWPSFASERATRNAVSRQFPATDLNLRRRQDATRRDVGGGGRPRRESKPPPPPPQYVSRRRHYTADMAVMSVCVSRCRSLHGTFLPMLAGVTSQVWDVTSTLISC